MNQWFPRGPPPFASDRHTRLCLRPSESACGLVPEHTQSGAERGENAFDDGRTAVQVELRHVLARLGARRGEPQHQRLIQLPLADQLRAQQQAMQAQQALAEGQTLSKVL